MCNHGNMRYDQVVMKLRLHHLFLQRGSKSMGLLVSENFFFTILTTSVKG